MLLIKGVDGGVVMLFISATLLGLLINVSYCSFTHELVRLDLRKSAVERREDCDSRFGFRMSCLVVWYLVVKMRRIHYVPWS